MAWLPASLLKTHTTTTKTTTTGAYRHARQRFAYGSFMKGDVMQQW